MAEIIPITEATRPFFLGVDVGGTGIKVGLVDDFGRTTAFETLETREPDGPDAAIDRIGSAFDAMLRQCGADAADVVAVGLGTPGPMDLAGGILFDPPQLPSWTNFPVRDALARRLGLPVAFTNDANAAAFGEYWLGPGRSSPSMVLLTLGTGVGGGIIFDGRLLGGVNSFGGEFGHLIVDSSPEARLCGWGGGLGQLEAYASATAVARHTAERLAAGAAGRLADLGRSPTPRDVYDAARHDDALALEIIDEAARWLGIGVTSIVHVLDPGIVVIGGAMTFGGAACPIGRRFLAGVVEEFRRRTFANVFAGTTISFAVLGSDAGYLGAAGYARALRQSGSLQPAGESATPPVGDGPP